MVIVVILKVNHAVPKPSCRHCSRIKEGKAIEMVTVILQHKTGQLENSLKVVDAGEEEEEEEEEEDIDEQEINTGLQVVPIVPPRS